MLKISNKPPNSVVKNISAGPRWKFITRANKISRYTMRQQRYFESNSIKADARGITSTTFFSSPPVFIAKSKASALAKHDHLTRQPAPPLAIYTDGSVVNKRLGAAAIARPLGTSSQAYLDGEANQDTTTAELMGIWMALSMATIADAREVVVFSDSQNALKAIRKPQNMLSCSIGSAVIEALQEIRRIGLGVQLHWVPARNGIIGNQMADNLARQAARFQKKPSTNHRAYEA